MKKRKLKFTITISCLLITSSIFSQNIGINTTGLAPAASAGLDVNFANKGLLIPRIALTGTADATTIAAPTTSLLVYNTATAGISPNNVIPGYYYWNGTKWIAFGGTGGRDWSLTGNSGTTVGTNFLGTTDNVSLAFKTNNLERMRITNAGNVGIGLASPRRSLDVNGEIVAVNRLTLAQNTGTTSLTWHLDNSVGTFRIFQQPNISTGGTVRLAILNTGFVGIGTSAPQRLLHLNGGGALIIGATGTVADIGTGLTNDVFSVTDATKWSINAYATGTNAGAGFFKNSNAANTKPTIDVKNYGTGEGVLSTSFSTGTAFSGQTNTALITGLFTNSNNSANVHVVDVQYNGSGTSGDIAVLGTASLAGATNGTGVRGEGGFTGIYGKQIAGGTYAGYFSGTTKIFGNLIITGSITKGSGTFLIDNPLDPANKYLYHSFVESPDMMNIYNGNITTDANGNATVTLPNYFTTLNMDYRYQLTTIGKFAQVMVLEKIKNNQFKIKSNIPNVEVSWQVTGIRNDPYAQKHRVIPVVEKAAKDKGKYLYPKAYGLPETQRIGYEKEHQEDNIKHYKVPVAKGKEE